MLHSKLERELIKRARRTIEHSKKLIRKAKELVEQKQSLLQRIAQTTSTMALRAARPARLPGCTSIR